MWKYTNFYKGKDEPYEKPNLSEQLVSFLNENKVTDWRITHQSDTYMEIAYKTN